MAINTQDSQHNTFIDNLCLVTSRWHPFVFLVNPIVSWSYILCILAILASDRDEEKLLRSIPFWLGAVYFGLSVGLASYRGTRLGYELEVSGRLQKWTFERAVDLWLNFALCAAFCCRIVGRTPDGLIWLWIDITSYGVALWGAILLFSLGSILWFAVRAH